VTPAINLNLDQQSLRNRVEFHSDRELICVLRIEVFG